MDVYWMAPPSTFVLKLPDLDRTTLWFCHDSVVSLGPSNTIYLPLAVATLKSKTAIHAGFIWRVWNTSEM
jgi:hypothetical protein